MSSRRALRVRERALTARERMRNSERAGAGAGSKNYRVIAISLYEDQAQSVEKATQNLQLAGYPKANRSFVIQAAIQRLSEDLAGKSPSEVVDYFVKHSAKRPLSAAQRRFPSREMTRTAGIQKTERGR